MAITKSLRTCKGNFGKAVYSECEYYRYLLEVMIVGTGARKGGFMFVGLNPSTADHNLPDPTVKRCLKRAIEWGASWFSMLNLFAFRATDPANMKRTESPIGAANNQILLQVASNADVIVFGWGNHGEHLGRSEEVVAFLSPFQDKTYHLGLTKSGEPKHPLYLAGSTPLQKWGVR